MKPNRIFVIGAGFSVVAGLPLAAELFREVRRDNAQLHGSDTKLERDLDEYIQYEERCHGRTISRDLVDIEQFLSFLDIEHYLQLRGSDTWSSEGNEAQIMIRGSIAKILHRRTPARAPDVYLRFAESLCPSDWILTFNYDTLLERALDQAGVRYRLFPYRFKKVGPVSCEIDNDRDEVVILKLHGSLDWFDRTRYEESLAVAELSSLKYMPRHGVFGRDAVVTPVPLTEGPRDLDDPLLKIYRVSNPERLHDRSYFDAVPLILSPSNNKLFYARPLVGFWRSLGQSGGLNFGLGVIGYSLPDYDDYAVQTLYRLARNYQYFAPDFEMDGLRKVPFRVLDYRPDEAGMADLHDRYRFLDWSRTEVWKDGLTCEAVDWFMRTSPTSEGRRGDSE